MSTRESRSHWLADTQLTHLGRNPASHEGTVNTPAVDVVKDFGNGHDVLDLSDLLQGESHTGTQVGNLGNYLHFEKSGADTVLNISTTGGYAGSFNAGATDQKVVLQGVDLTTLGTDTQIIQNLLTNGKLNTD